jgi:hypothetical protein
MPVSRGGCDRSQLTSFQRCRERIHPIRSLQSFLPLLLLSGCYSYTALEQPSPEPGVRVAAQLTDAGSVEMASQIGPGIVTVRGAVVQTDSQALLLALSSVVGRNEQEVFWSGEQVRVPLSSVRQVQRRRFALGKSLLFAGAAVGGLFGAIKAFEGSAAGGGGGGGGGPEPQ